MSERKPPPTRSDYSVFYKIQTRWMDNDVYGHMNNVVHYSLFDTAVNGWLIEKGLLDPWRGATYGLVVETGCRYHKEVAFPTPIEAGIKVARLGNTSVRYEIGLFAEGADQACADGFFVHVNVERESHKPAPYDEKWREALSQISG